MEKSFATFALLSLRPCVKIKIMNAGCIPNGMRVSWLIVFYQALHSFRQAQSIAQRNAETEK